MITYQFFTETAVKTVMNEIIIRWPEMGLLLYNRLDLLVFIYAFSWVFVLSSVIPSLILGKERGTFVQFVVVLIITISTLRLQDVFVTYTGIEIERLFSLVVFFRNPIDAAFYLFFPYLLMFLVDIFGRASKQKQVELNTTHYPATQTSN